MKRGSYHVPVMLKECIEGLKIHPSGIYIDCTFGGGGHSRAILGHLNKEGKLLAFDQDEDARINLPDDPRLIFVHANFRFLKRFLRLHGITQVDGILADLGISSFQIDTASRGFSTRHNGPLDMRMNAEAEKSAADIVREYSKEQLHKLFEKFGEVTNAKTLATAIVEARSSHSLDTTQGFQDALFHVVKGNPDKYFAKVFQALRIEVNQELLSLEELLQQVPEMLMPGGRIAIITFHSLEDRIVKNYFRYGSFEKKEDNSIYGMQSSGDLNIITKKPITPAPDELKGNPRSRSAKLRIAEKVSPEKN